MFVTSINDLIMWIIPSKIKWESWDLFVIPTAISLKPVLLVTIAA